MQRIPMPAAVAAITILATGCIADDDQAHPTVTVTTGMASGQGLLLVTDAAGAWQPVAIVDGQPLRTGDASVWRGIRVPLRQRPCD